MVSKTTVGSPILSARAFMKRFFLYFLLFLFIAGLAMLAFGFWNAKNIRGWASAAGEIKARHDISAKENGIMANLNALGGKQAEEFKNELDNFQSNLDSISNELDSAKNELEQNSAPRAAKPLQLEMIDYYSQSSQNIRNLAGVIGFTGQVFEVTIIFDKIKSDTTLNEIKGMIGEAKAKSGGINPDILPSEIRDSGAGLKTAVNNYLDALDQYAAGKAESHDQLDASYADFTQKQTEFWETRKHLAIYTDIQSLGARGNQIDSELLVLERVRFSIK